MRKNIISLWFFVFVLIGTLVVFYLRTIYSNSTELTIAENGVFTFSKAEIDTRNILKLHGEVEFYNDTLLIPDNISNHIPSGMVEIPGEWNDFEVDSHRIGGHGKGTYRFMIDVPGKGWYGLKIKEFKSSYSLWVNGEHLGGAGIVGSTKKAMKPSRVRQEFYFLTDTTRIEVVIQASNFHHYKGGATETIVFGKAKNIMEYKTFQVGVEVFVFGILLILFIYHLVLYAYRRKDKSILYFSLLCLSMLLRLGYIGEKILLEIAAFIPWFIAIRIEYISFFAIALFTVLFFNELFPKEVKQWLVKVIYFFCVLFIVIVLFTPSTVFSYTPLFYILTVGVWSLLLMGVLINAIIHKRKYSTAIFIGYFVFFLFSINDMFFYVNFIDTTTLMPLGLLILCISQAYVLATKTSSAYTRIEHLSGELTKHASELELKVERRTQTIQKQKEEIETQKNELQVQAEELKQNNEKLITLANFKNEMTHMMIHDLKNPLNNIMGFASLPGAVGKYNEHIYASGWEMQNLILNILDVEKYESVKMVLNKTDLSLREVVEQAFESLRYLVQRKCIQMTNNIAENEFVNVDADLVARVFSNILSNAVKYSDTNGVVEVSASQVEIAEKRFCKVNIYNSGDTIPSEKLDSVFTKFYQIDSSDKYINYSTGIGLTFCRMAVEEHGGKIGAISGKEKGVSFWFTLPV